MQASFSGGHMALPPVGADQSGHKLLLFLVDLTFALAFFAIAVSLAP
jgi:hypothetical protein